MLPRLEFSTARDLFLLEFISLTILACGIAFHSCVRAFFSSFRLPVGTGQTLNLLSILSHWCSIGLRSGVFAGHGSTCMPRLASWAVTTRAVCGVALSHMKVRTFGWFWNKANTCSLMTSSMYTCAFTFPAKWTIFVLKSNPMAPQMQHPLPEFCLFLQ